MWILGYSVSCFVVFLLIYFIYMTDIVVMNRKEGEGATSLYHRFVKQFRSSGVQTTVRNNRFRARRPSKAIRKKDCINRLVKREKYEEAYRLGKISAPQRGYRR